MRKFLFFSIVFLCFFLLVSCGSSERTVTITPRPVEIVENDLSTGTEKTAEKTPAESVTDGQSEISYILNISSKKVHLPHCSGVKQMKEENKVAYTGPLSEIMKEGYALCGICKPQ